jgi:hypothetical protein
MEPVYKKMSVTSSGQSINDALLGSPASAVTRRYLAEQRAVVELFAHLTALKASIRASW